ncbi:hypothetical protein MKX01_006418 [Papaver californicum]|nr:hypothetical protein MKX01_006418 [Papaver californicum]
MPPPTMKLSKQFLRSNASFLLCRENPSKFTGLRKTEPIYMVPPVPGQPKQDDLNPPRMKILERFFIDLVAGDQLSQDRASSRFTSLVGSTDEMSLERRNRAWSELNMCCRKNIKVKGFIMEKIRGGFSVGIAGFIAFMPQKRMTGNFGGGMGVLPNRFIIENIDVKKMKIVVSPAQQPFRIRKEDTDRFWKPMTMPLPSTTVNNGGSLPTNPLFLNRRGVQAEATPANKWGNEYQSPSRGLRNGWESQQPAPLSDKERDGFASVTRGLLHGWGSQQSRI